MGAINKYLASLLMPAGYRYLRTTYNKCKHKKVSFHRLRGYRDFSNQDRGFSEYSMPFLGEPVDEGPQCCAARPTSSAFGNRQQIFVESVVTPLYLHQLETNLLQKLNSTQFSSFQETSWLIRWLVACLVACLDKLVGWLAGWISWLDGSIVLATSEKTRKD